MSFVSELKRRNVIRAVVAYFAAGWLLIQIADVVFPIYEVPESVLETLTTVLLVGVIPAAVLAWALEWTPQGIMRDAEAVVAGSGGSNKSIDRAIIVVLSLALLVFAFDRFVLDPTRDTAREQAAEERGRINALIESYGDRSIAVLPFVNMSSDREQDYFSDGVAEEILNLLATIDGLRVISRSSAFRYRGEVDISDVAEELNVAYLLSGSVRKAGDQIRISAQLIDARSDTHVWSNTWNRELTEIFDIQEEVAAQVADDLRVRILGADPQSIRTDPDLYVMYLQAKHEMVGRLPTKSAIERLEHVVEADPDYQPAAMLLAFSYYRATGMSTNHIFAPDVGYPIADAMAQRALAINPDNPVANAHNSYERLETFHDLPGALESAAIAYRGARGDAEVLGILGGFAATIGKFEQALRLTEASVIRDPHCLRCLAELANIYTLTGRIENAERTIRQRMVLAPGGWYALGNILLLRGDTDGALRAYEGIAPGSALRSVGRAKALYSAGRLEEYEATVAEILQAARQPSPGTLAVMFAWAGDADNAFLWLDEHVESSSRGLSPLLWRPELEPIRRDPRWREFWDEHWYTEDEFAAVELDIR